MTRIGLDDSDESDRRRAIRKQLSDYQRKRAELKAAAKEAKKPVPTGTFEDTTGGRNPFGGAEIATIGNIVSPQILQPRIGTGIAQDFTVAAQRTASGSIIGTAYDPTAVQLMVNGKVFRVDSYDPRTGMYTVSIASPTPLSAKDIERQQNEVEETQEKALVASGAQFAEYTPAEDALLRKLVRVGTIARQASKTMIAFKVMRDKKVVPVVEPMGFDEQCFKYAWEEESK